MTKLKNQRLKKCRRYKRYLYRLELRMMPKGYAGRSVEEQYEWWWATYWQHGSEAGVAVPWSIVYREQGMRGRAYRR